MGVSQPTRKGGKKNNSRQRQYKKWANKLQSKKEIIELENFKKAKILKKYAKLCAEEGIESSRVNVPGQEREGAGEDKGRGTREHSGQEEAGGDDAGCDGKRAKKSRGHRLSSLQKAHQDFQKNKGKDGAAPSSQKDSRGGSSGGKKPRRVHAETKKGQPIMRAQITRMLETLQAGGD
mmetsp:Transcript_10087/g.16736  ORF Transcript_10087/g.16736 Transcript_10087/m.16736 type:complete len:178 (+) Transcript_10087:105-638(+)